MDTLKLPREKIRAVFSDLDDTLTEGSRLPSQVVHALESLAKKGYWTVIVSGRPAGWGDCLMRLLPIDAFIFENGAGLMVRDGEKIFTETLAENLDREEQRTKLQSVFEKIQEKIPHVKLATDQPYRLFDFAIDFIEEPPILSEQEIQLVLTLLSAEKDITAKLSSIHVNYWCGKHTKVTAVEKLLETEGRKRQISKEEVVFSGDSPNDEPLFQYFPHSVGVANVEKFLPRMKHRPKYMTRERGGSGFVEMVHSLLF